MMAIHDFPRCAGYLKAMRYHLDDPAMSDYAWATVLADTWSEEELIADGRVNFDTMGGTDILVEFERLLADGMRKAREFIDTADMESLKAFVGSRGVKASALKSPEDFWKVAHILWPHAVKKGRTGSLTELVGIIRSMSKKSRSTARQNIAKVPAEWRA